MAYRNNNNFHYPRLSGLSSNKRIFAPYRGTPICRNCYATIPWHKSWCFAEDSELDLDDVDALDDSELSDDSADTEVIDDDEEWADFIAPEDEEDLPEAESTSANPVESESATVSFDSCPSKSIPQE